MLCPGLLTAFVYCTALASREVSLGLTSQSCSPSSRVGAHKILSGQFSHKGHALYNTKRLNENRSSAKC